MLILRNICFYIAYYIGSTFYVIAALLAFLFGKSLFRRSADWAKVHGAKKLYISAHSSLESQAFYAAMGCVEAEEYDPVHVENEPGACQLEFVLGNADR